MCELFSVMRVLKLQVFHSFCRNLSCAAAYKKSVLKKETLRRRAFAFSRHSTAKPSLSITRRIAALSSSVRMVAVLP